MSVQELIAELTAGCQRGDWHMDSPVFVGHGYAPRLRPCGLEFVGPGQFSIPARPGMTMVFGSGQPDRPAVDIEADVPRRYGR